MVKKDAIKFETWRGKRVITVRDSKGRLLSRLPVKGSGIKTKEQAFNNYRETGTINPKTGATSNRNTFVTKKDVTTIAVKGIGKSKRVNVKGKGFRQAKQIGSNTAIIQTQKVLKTQQHYQYKVNVNWGGTETIGYSDIRGTEKQGFDRAKAGAIQLNIIRYDWTIEFLNKNQGVATAPSRRKKVLFTINSEVQTYVNTTKTFNTSKV